MLPFRVTQIEQHRDPQQNATKPNLAHLLPATKLLSEREFARANRQIADPVPDRSSRRHFTVVSAQNPCCLTQKNGPVLAKWAPTSNRQWPANRSYRKQTTKPFLTGARTHIRLSPNFTKIAHDFATFESQNTELPLWNPLWKTRRFLQSGGTSNRNWTKNRSCRKQAIKPRLTGARTHVWIVGVFDQFSTKVVIEKP
jgi:hypothetical protein